MTSTRSAPRLSPRRRPRPDETVVVAYCGRGAVVWRPGRLRYAGPRDEARRELERSVEALVEMEHVDLSSADSVRGALLSVGGARLLRAPHSSAHRRQSGE